MRRAGVHNGHEQRAQAQLRREDGHAAVKGAVRHGVLDRLLIGQRGHRDVLGELAGRQRGGERLGRRARHADVHSCHVGTAGEGQPEDGRHQQRRRQAPDEDRAIAQPAMELVHTMTRINPGALSR